MLKLKNPLPLALGLFFILAGSGCQSIDKPKSTIEGHSSFRFLDSRNINDDRFSPPTNELDRLIQQEIRNVFAARGLAYEPENAELVIGYLVIRMDNVSTTVIPTYYGEDHAQIRSLAHKKGVLKSRNPGNFEKGAIVIDIIDAAEEELIYRDSAQRDIMGVTDVSEMRPLVESAVEEALAGFFKGR